MDPETTVKKYQTLLNEEKLCAAACSSCNELMLPPRLFCSNCNQKITSWQELSGRGKLKSFTVIHIAGTRYADEVPYVVAIVELEEGPSVCVRFVGVDPMKPEELHIGDPVIADFEDYLSTDSEEKEKRLVFRPA